MHGHGQATNDPSVWAHYVIWGLTKAIGRTHLLHLLLRLLLLRLLLLLLLLRLRSLQLLERRSTFPR